LLEQVWDKNYKFNYKNGKRLADVLREICHYESENTLKAIILNKND